MALWTVGFATTRRTNTRGIARKPPAVFQLSDDEDAVLFVGSHPFLLPIWHQWAMLFIDDWKECVAQLTLETCLLLRPFEASKTRLCRRV